jgi:hypothetical protein
MITIYRVGNRQLLRNAAGMSVEIIFVEGEK